MSEHTKGPWVIDGDYILEQGKCADPFDNIAVVGDKNEWQANARLIAAAPCLKQSVEELIELLSNIYPSHDSELVVAASNSRRRYDREFEFYTDPVIEKARAVLAKVEVPE